MPDMQTIDLDRPRTLRFTLGSLRLLQQRLSNMSLMQIANRIEQVDIEAIVQAVWVGLTHEDRKLTLEKAQELIDAKLQNGLRMSDVIRPLVQAIMQGGGLIAAAEGEADQGKASEPPA